MNRKVSRAVKLAALSKDFVSLRRKRDEGARLRVVDRLMQLHGLPQKIGQILSLTELRDETPVFRGLTETNAVLSLDEVKSLITHGLGIPWNVCFRSVDGPGIGASLAQVHRATLLDGRTVAIKIQLPHIAESVELDLKALGWLTVPVGGLRRGFDLASYRREVGTMLREELDFRHEAEALRTFGAFAKQFPNVVVPEVIEEFSHEAILTMTWIEGDSFSTARKWPNKLREQIGSTMLEFFFASIFSAQRFHADPHPGNYRFSHSRDRAMVSVLDFGCTRELPYGTAVALRTLIEDSISGEVIRDGRRAFSRFVGLGFHPGLLAPMESRLPALCEILFEPFLFDRPFDLAGWRLGERVSEALGDYRWNFRTAGPASLIYFMRAYQGLIQYLDALEVPLNWRTVFEKSLPPKTVEKGASFTAKESWSAAVTRVLKIRVVRAGVTKAELTFPATAAENLVDLVPEEIGPRLSTRDIDIAAISRRAVSDGFPAGELFRLSEGKDDFAVWLE